MPPKKSAAKTADKKPGKQALNGVEQDLDGVEKDARRTFEHLGRVQTLASFVTKRQSELTLLTKSADAAYQSQKYQVSADMLRAAEHICFASVQEEATETISSDLKQAIEKEFKKLDKKTRERSEKKTPAAQIRSLIERLQADAEAALQRTSYRAALELMRGAEALSHVADLPKLIASTAAPKRLQR